MKALMKAALLAGAAWSVVPTLAVAQETVSDAAVDEVVVTARRREESLKDVPVAVTAVSGERLEATGAVDITTLQQSTPNLTVQVARGSNSTLISFIRGVGQQDPLWGFEPGVGLYIDDVYIARPQAAVLDIFDIERVEVLRGPQGTLYGRNTIGGAIKYVTGKIEGEPELKLKGNFGSYEQLDFIASAKARLTDQIGVGLTWATFNRDGFGKNLTTGAEHYDKDVSAARATIEYSPTDSLFFRLSGDIVTDRSNPRHGHRETPLITLAGPVPTLPVLDDVYDTRAGAGDKNLVEARGVSLLGQWDISDTLTFKSISAYRAGETRGIIDFDTEAAPLLDIPAKYNDHQFSQELQLLYTGERLQGVFGVYYLNATAAGAFDTVLGQANLTTATAGHVDTESWSAFADVSYDVTDQLSISVGGRYTRDEKTGNVYRQQFLGIRSPLFGNNAATPLLPLRSNFTSSDTYERFTPRVSVRYEFTPDLTGYASYSQGFKSGGFDMRADALLTPSSVEGYEPEKVESYEAGLKGYFFDRRLTLNSAVFYARYKDQQVTVQTPVGTAIASQVLNVGKSHMYGVELEGSAALTDSLSANFSLGYIKAEFDEYSALDLTATPPVIRDFSDERVFQNTPEWSGAFSLTYVHDMGDRGSISIIPAASYRSSINMFEIPSIIDQDSYWLVDASIVWTSADDRYRVGLHGRNLTDEEYRVGGYTFAGALFGNSINAFYGPPRTVTLSLEAKF